jgi:hypothetical protein
MLPFRVIEPLRAHRRAAVAPSRANTFSREITQSESAGSKHELLIIFGVTRSAPMFEGFDSSDSYLSGAARTSGQSRSGQRAK